MAVDLSAARDRLSKIVEECPPGEMAQRLNALTIQLVGRDPMLNALGRLATLIETTPVSLTFREMPTFEEWEQVGYLLQHMESAVMWWLGDWAAYGNDAYGESYAQAIRVHEITGRPIGSVRAAQWVSDRYKLDTRVAGLPWTFHREAGALDEPERGALLAEADADGWTRQELRERIRQDTRQHRLRDPGTLAVGEYRTIVADPPWRYPKGTAFDRPQSLPDAHYGTLSDEEIIGFAVKGTPVARLAPDEAHLYLWTTHHHLNLAFDVMEAWEFEYRHTLTWCKSSLGTGAYHRNTSEFVLFGVRGNLPLREMDQGTWFVAPAVEHSAKPLEFYRIVERCCLPPYLDLFGRRERPGWEVWGNEVDDGVRPAFVGGR